MISLHRQECVSFGAQYSPLHLQLKAATSKETVGLNLLLIHGSTAGVTAKMLGVFDNGMMGSPFSERKESPCSGAAGLIGRASTKM